MSAGVSATRSVSPRTRSAPRAGGETTTAVVLSGGASLGALQVGMLHALYAASSRTCYKAALDREGAAASVYARLMRLTCGPTGEPGDSRSADQANHTPGDEGRC